MRCSRSRIAERKRPFMKNTAKVIALLCLSGLNLAQSTHKSGRTEETTKAIAGHIEVRGVRLQYLDWGGSGEGLLLVPGGCDTAYVFGDVAPAFTALVYMVGMLFSAANFIFSSTSFE